MESEYRALVQCSEDPCSYCHKPQRRKVVEGVFDTEQEALKRGWRIAVNVYGGSVHRVLVESRQVTEWEQF